MRLTFQNLLIFRIKIWFFTLHRFPPKSVSCSLNGFFYDENQKSKHSHNKLNTLNSKILGNKRCLNLVSLK